MDTILIIDDSPFEIRLLSAFLNDKGIKVLVANDGIGGLEQIELAMPDLILLDILMPKMDGFEVCKRLKNNDQTKNIPIIFSTARTELLDKLKGFELGAADYITKPFDHEEALARINTHLKLHQLQQQHARQNDLLQQEIKQRQQIEQSLQAERNALAEHMMALSDANTKLAQAARLKDEFLANMSHELRTPLNAILGISESFLEEIYGPINDKQRKFLHILEDSGHHLLSLINDILDLSQIEANKLTLEINAVSVNKICQASLGMIKEAAFKKQIRVTFTLDYAINTIQADERRLTQILVNLLSNAIKFTQKGGSIRLEVEGEAQVVHFRVFDTGIGIAEKDMKYLFEPFVQLDGSLSRAQEGTGLGLSLVCRLTEMHGGSISVESSVGEGSCFTISLPWQPKSQ